MHKQPPRGERLRVPQARLVKASTARSAARAKADQARPVRRLFGTPSGAPAGVGAADPQEGKRSAQRRSGAKASVERSERPMEARRGETPQAARCTARQRDAATGRGTPRSSLNSRAPAQQPCSPALGDHYDGVNEHQKGNHQ